MVHVACYIDIQNTRTVPQKTTMADIDEEESVNRKKKELHASLLARLMGMIHKEGPGYPALLTRLKGKGLTNKEANLCKQDDFNLFEILQNRGILDIGRYEVLKDSLKELYHPAINTINKYEDKIKKIEIRKRGQQDLQHEPMWSASKQGNSSTVPSTPKQANRSTMSSIPKQANKSTVPSTPKQAKRSTVPSTPKQANVSTMSSTTKQAKRSIVASTSKQAIRSTMSSTPKQANRSTMSSTPKQANKSTVPSTPKQANRSTMSSTPKQANRSRSTMSSTPKQAKESTVPSTPKQANRSTVASTSKQAKGSTVTSTSKQANRSTVASTSKQANRSTVASTSKQANRSTVPSNPKQTNTSRVTQSQRNKPVTARTQRDTVRHKKEATRPRSRYSDMIKAAISKLHERSGSSGKAILKYIMAVYEVSPDVNKVNTRLKIALTKEVKKKSIIKDKTTGLFKLSVRKPE